MSADVEGDILPTFVSPQVTKNKMKEVDAYANALQTQSVGVATSNPAMWSAFMQDFAAWKRFYADNIDVSLAAKAVLEQTEAWQLKLQEWRKKLEVAGAKIETVEPAPPEKFLTPGEGLGLGVVLAAAVVFYLATRNSK